MKKLLVLLLMAGLVFSAFLIFGNDSSADVIASCKKPKDDSVFQETYFAPCWAAGGHGNCNQAGWFCCVGDGWSYCRELPI